ncbi:GM19591 [Drosophila sechellia]|uniref:GM19591 n=1 Tax=Drosophila sechellia TaxID=7238 RepID=B4ILW4_DROSE|nr:GM19591 [Drosophila sechellia]
MSASYVLGLRYFLTIPHNVGSFKGGLDGSHAFEVSGTDFCGPFFYKPAAHNKAPDLTVQQFNEVCVVYKVELEQISKHIKKFERRL